MKETTLRYCSLAPVSAVLLIRLVKTAHKLLKGNVIISRAAIEARQRLYMTMTAPAFANLIYVEFQDRGIRCFRHHGNAQIDRPLLGSYIIILTCIEIYSHKFYEDL